MVYTCTMRLNPNLFPCSQYVSLLKSICYPRGCSSAAKNNFFFFFVFFIIPLQSHVNKRERKQANNKCSARAQLTCARLEYDEDRLGRFRLQFNRFETQIDSLSRSNTQHIQNILFPRYNRCFFLLSKGHE